jgi:hypothetical protein
MVLMLVNRHARLVIYGAISQYEHSQNPVGPGNYIQLIAQSWLMQGFTMRDYIHRAKQAVELPTGQVIQDSVDIIDHFEQHPFLRGGLLSVADYGLFAPLYAHLSRDTYPGMIMKCKAQRVYRWIERMNSQNTDMPEYPNYFRHYFLDDEIPDNLRAILTLIGKEFLPEVKCMVRKVSQWLANNPVEEGECVTEKPRIKSINPMDFPFRGTTVTGMVIPYQLRDYFNDKHN